MIWPAMFNWVMGVILVRKPLRIGVCLSAMVLGNLLLLLAGVAGI